MSYTWSLSTSCIQSGDCSLHSQVSYVTTSADSVSQKTNVQVQYKFCCKTITLLHAWEMWKMWNGKVLCYQLVCWCFDWRLQLKVHKKVWTKFNLPSNALLRIHVIGDQCDWLIVVHINLVLNTQPTITCCRAIKRKTRTSYQTLVALLHGSTKKLHWWCQPEHVDMYNYLQAQLET